MARRYLVRPLPDPGRAVLPAEVGRHLRTVLRAKPGTVVRLFDGRGLEADARIESLGRDRVDVVVENHVSVEREPRVRVELACAVPKGARGDWLFEHATEVGVAAFRPVRFVRSLPTRTDAVARWRRIVDAAAGQCDRSLVPEVHAPIDLGDLLALDLPAERFAAAPSAPVPLGRATGPATILIVGPAGGLSDAELGALADAGFDPRGLGPLTLRTETAARVGAARLLM